MQALYQYDNGKSVVIAEYAKRETGVLVTNDMSSAYLTVGHRFGGLMPYATYAIARRDGEQESALPSTNPLSAIVGGVTAATANDQDTYSVGLRYDVPSFSVLKGAIVKLQYDHIKAKEGSGLFINVQPGFEGKADMISATFDFIF